MSAAPPSDPGRLAALRRELDGVDDALSDLLSRRAGIAAEIGRSGAKGRARFRPGREACILRRLLARPDGLLAPALVVALWREMFAASIALQGPFELAVAEGDPALEACARAHFRIPPAIRFAPDAPAWPGSAHAAVLPWFDAGPDWWAHLGPVGGWYVAARLPFLADTKAPQAVVVAPDPPDPSGKDRSLLLARVGFDPAAHGFAPLAGWERGGRALHEVDGYVPADDPRLRDAAAVLAGAYAVPVHA